jgi:hypothetical protein
MQLEQKLDLMVQLVLRARTFLDLWWVYEGKPTRGKYLPAMNLYPEFFRFDSHAHQVAYTIYLCQLFEKHPKTLNINNVLKEAKARGVSGGNLAVAEKALQEALPIVKKLVILRHNLFAHRSGSLSYADAFKKAAVTPNQIRRLTELGLEAINSLRTALGQTDFEFSTLPHTHLEELLEEINPK